MIMTIIAVPSDHPGGLDAGIGAHFGHCDLYTLVTEENGTITKVEVIPNVPHVQGGCLAPVQYLAGNGVNCLIAGGMGFRPLMGFNQVGIKVFYGANAGSVGEAVKDAIDGKLVEFRQEHTCGGGQH